METVKEMCGDNRFEVIQRSKEHLLEATNIETSPDEMKVLDSFLFRAWQMGWLRQYEPTLRNATDTKVGGKSGPSDEWVSVDERLPEICDEYIVIIEGAKRATWLFYNGNGEWICEYGSSYKVTHWQPFPNVPEPPKGAR